MDFNTFINAGQGHLSKNTFYNTKNSAFTFGISISKPSMQLTFAKSLKPDVRPNEIKKGDKIYDWENSIHFSLSPLECFKMVSAFPEIEKGTYVDKDEKDEKYKKTFKLNHYGAGGSGKSMSSLSINKTDYGLISISVYSNGTRVTYPFRFEELRVFTEFVRVCAKELYFYKGILDSMYQHFKFITYQSNKGDSAESKESSSNGKYKSNGKYSTKTMDDAGDANSGGDDNYVLGDPEAEAGASSGSSLDW